MRQRSFHLIILLLAASVIYGCSSGKIHRDAPQGNAMYFWRTTLRLDSTERTFLRHNDVKCLYIRFFDVVTDTPDGEPHPNATLYFPDGNIIPEGMRYVPVVFVTPASIASSRNLPELAGMIVKRVKDMAGTNMLPPPDEIQIDCDWTASTRQTFSDFMESVCDEARRHDMTTSVTIRLHQLSQKPPRADYGVLMVYNTGNLTDPDKGNPILSSGAVEPYLKYLRNYPMPLVAAYPNFRWPVLYAPDDNGHEKFAGILYGCKPDDEPDFFRQTAPGVWTVVGSSRYNTAVGNMESAVRIVPGMTLRIFSPPSVREMLALKRALASHNPHINQEVILYDLNSDNIDIYKGNYEKIFAH